MFAMVDRAAEEMLGYDPETLFACNITEGIHALARLRTIVEAAWLATLVQAEKLGTPRQAGYRTTADYLAAETGERRGHCARDIDLAKRIAEQPLLATAIGTGEVSRAKIAELVRACDATDEEQTELLAGAATKSVKDIQAMVEAFRAAKGAEPPKIENKVTITHGVGGGVITAELDTLRLNMVEIALDMAITKLGLPTDIPYTTRRAEALVAIAKFFVEHADNTTTIRGTRPHVSVIIDIETLENRANRPCRLENGDYLTAEQARQLCCDARITRIVTGPRSQPLDIGTQSRTFTPGMARAIIARDKHCTHTGCQAPPWACDIHHTKHVTNNGHTSVDNGQLKCWHHHDWQHQHDRQQHTQTREHEHDRQHEHDPQPVAA